MKKTTNKTKETKIKGIFKKIVIFTIVAFVLTKCTEDDGDYYGNYEDTYCENTTYGDTTYGDTTYEDTTYEDISYGDTFYDDTTTYVDNYGTENYSDVVGVWSNEGETLAIYDTGYAEVISGNQSLDYSWSASNTMITFVPCNQLESETVSMYYEISGNTAYFTSDGETVVLYRN